MERPSIRRKLEEILNSITHGLGVAGGITGLVLLLVYASSRTSGVIIGSFAIFGSCVILLYLASTLYHSLSFTRARNILRIIDHGAIFLLIAGTYTPFTLATIKGTTGLVLLACIWVAALAGIIFKACFIHRLKIISVLLYIFMGWIAIFFAKPIANNIQTAGLILLIAGGLSYTLGTIFYAWKKLPFHHTIWHFFVLGGTTCHFISMFFIV